ncbi:MAG TPA: valine--tRNA ligase [Candidatus Methylomirabilis sp.]|nr:valine--tRNA ligase [Candidatus Methylomirabilis sp.]
MTDKHEPAASHLEAPPAGEPATKQGYDPQGVEAQWYRFWEAQNLFHADVTRDAPPYSIVIPPPNVTGSLHMGHALNNTLQDILIRWHRMRGDNTLWMPGTDHAGIATQNVVERQLRQEGLTRDQLGREAFIQRVWRWKAESGGTIIRQLKTLGASCDWVRERFTLDPGLSEAVKEVFCQLYEAGLIYRGDYIINWCPRCQTALSDLEVEYQERNGKLWHIRYPLASGAGEVVVATTRPETMLGDTAVAVHPEDDRHADLVGRSVILPIMNREIPIIADSYVDREFGTGMVKVTPAHDPKDFECGLRHNLPQVKVIADDGSMNGNAGPYQGLDRFACRERLVKDLTRDGFLVRVEEHRHAVGQCYRCQTVVEPSLSRQWFVKMTPLAEPAIRAVEEGRIRIIPGQWEKTYFEWMRNIRDWCVSRQIWWGHRIPAWYCDPCGETIVSRTTPTACPRCGRGDLRQETDVLDTWFSSGLWPFSTLGWPERTKELAVYYPTSCLVTGFDILFFWVARMIMLGLRFMGDVPFRDVVIHGLIRDELGEKMSKTRGNVIDPLHVINGATLEELLASAKTGGAPPAALEGLRRQFPEGFPRFGADALRFTLAALAGLGSDIKLSVKRIEGYRHFCNKLWNAYRFAERYIQADDEAAVRAAELPLTLADRWILTRLNQVTAGVTEALTGYRFNDAASVLYQFLWHEYCDWYLEIVKNRLAAPESEADARTGRLLLVHVLEQSLRLLHPIMPFITEEIWQRLPHRGASIMVASWPQPDPALDWPEAVERMDVLMEITREVRNIRSTYNIPPGKRLPLVLHTTSAAQDGILESCRGYLASLARLSQLTFGRGVPKPNVTATAVVKGIEVHVPLEDVIDLREEQGRITRELAKVEKALERITKKLGNDEFLGKAPAAVVSQERAARAELLETQAKLQESVARITAHLDR